MKDLPLRDAYAPPIESDASATAASRRAGWSRRLLGAAAVAFVLAIPLSVGLRSVGVLRAGWVLAALLAGSGAAAGASALVSAGGLTLATGASTVANLLIALLGAAGTYLTTATFSRGRQLRSFGRVLLARVRAAGDWSTLSFEVQADDAARAALAREWRENGRTEHASVAAFARLTLDLMALGAPPSLIAASNRDALDEIRHTELCFSIARALDGKADGPGPFPEARSARTLSQARSLALASLAVDSLVDGALHEGVSARVIARLARRCEEPTIRGALKEIAADEGRHAAHGWDVVEWCLATGGAPVAHALAGAVSVLPRTLATARPEVAGAGAWERYGIPGAELEEEELAQARADIEGRVRLMLRRFSDREAARAAA